MPIQCDAPAVGQIEARHQVGQCALAAAGCANQCDGLSCRDFQADVAQCQPVILLIGQAHVLECDAPTGAPYVLFPGIGFTGCVEQFKYAFRCRQPALQVLAYAGQAFDRGGQHQHGCNK